VLWEQERPKAIVSLHRVMRAAIDEICDENLEDEGEDAA